MICFPNAKVNLGLQVTGKRQDGYHNIETVFYPVNLTDILEITAASKNNKKNNFINTGNRIDVDPADNLCMRAWTELDKNYSLSDVHIHLHKVIPTGAGLGGGSSNAAFVLLTLNDMFSLDLSEPVLSSVAGRIGSDCPFFIYNKPMFARERGNVFEPVDINLAGFYILIIHPGIQISTAWAYSAIKTGKHRESLKDIICTDPVKWQDRIINDFETVVFDAYPAVRGIKEKLLACGAFYASMSGSGSSVYGLFDDKMDAGVIENKFPGMYTWQGVLQGF